MVLSRQPPATHTPAFELTHPIGFAILYLDDIDAIHRFLSQRAETVVLSAGSATADSAEDLVSATKKEVESVAFRTVNPETTLWLSLDRCFARTDDQAPEAQRLTIDVANLVRNDHGGGGVAGFWKLLFTEGWLGLLLAVSVIPAMYFSAPKDQWGWGLGFVIFGVATALFFTVNAWKVWSKRGRAVVIPTKRAEARTSRSSSRASLNSGLLIAIVSVIVSVVLTLVATNLWAN
jgi:hypothetical protein